MNYLKLFLKGMIVGVANVIPGVSGGTIAVVMGIFDELIDAVNNFYKDFRRYFVFLAPIGLGAVAGIFLFSRVVSFCLENYSLPTNLFFAGLVAGSIPLIRRKASESGGASNIIAYFAGIAVVAGIAFLNSGVERETITTLTAQNAATLFFAGLIASAAMVMPGVSGSLVLVLMGYYGTFVKAVSDFNIPLLIVICAGVGTGILLISKIIDILLKRAYTITYSAIYGLIAASLALILFDPASFQTGREPIFIALGAVLAVLGFITAYKLSD